MNQIRHFSQLLVVFLLIFNCGMARAWLLQPENSPDYQEFVDSFGQAAILAFQSFSILNDRLAEAETKNSEITYNTLSEAIDLIEKSHGIYVELSESQDLSDLPMKWSTLEVLPGSEELMRFRNEYTANSGKQINNALDMAESLRDLSKEILTNMMRVGEITIAPGQAEVAGRAALVELMDSVRVFVGVGNVAAAALQAPESLRQ